MNPVLELVEIQLTQPFDDFIRFFEGEQLPVLLNAPGIKSVRTGPKLLRQSYQSESNEAVSFTQWESLEAHEAFVQSEAAKGFFQRVSHWISGPPIVKHYDVGSFLGLDNLSVVSVVTSAEEDRQFLEGLDRNEINRRSGRCIEDETRWICIVFFPDLAGVEGLQEHVQVDFTVPVRSIGLAAHKSVL